MKTNTKADFYLKLTNFITIAVLCVACICFKDEKSDLFALGYFFSTDFPVSAVTQSQQTLFQAIKFVGAIIGLLSLCRVQVTLHPPVKILSITLIACAILLGILAASLSHMMIVNFVPALILCFESLLILNLSQK